MNRQELIESIVNKTALSKKDTDAVLKAFIEVVTKAVKKGDKVQLIGFGTFERTTRSARTGRNPQTGAEIKIAAKKAPRFVAGKAFKDAVNGK